MKRVWVLFAALGLALAGCKTMEPRPEPPPADCSDPGGTPPTAPPMQTIPETGVLPPIPPATKNIVTTFCPSTGQYLAAGIDTESRRFTFMIRGGRGTQQAAFASFYQARVPVTVYTGPVKLATRGTPAPKPTTPPPAPVPTPAPGGGEDDDSGSGGGKVIDPCLNISEEPPPSPKPGGNNPYEEFESLSWWTAYAVESVAKPVNSITAPGTVPAPR
ncbi:hypothetical protein [Hyalangium rubrum]|uniref:Lipoprotein n=1 Tax=Hyalangium rubrum TaxID=3103134 RepID=A0ABU5HJ13_9BACT|nr:hypothetical protein [Hyalangium sp. s54d21]MDY7233154.1 hypothetical protein [Hyalangium sp. s54d21]